MASYTKTAVPGIFKRGNTYSVAIRDGITKRVKFTSAGPSFNDAKALKRRLETAKAQGQGSGDARILLPALWTEFETNHLANLSPSTQADYRSVAKRYLLPRYRRTPVASIDAAEVMRFRDHLAKAKSPKGTPLSTKRQRNVLVVLASLLSYGVATGKIFVNPVQQLQRGTKPAMGENRKVFLSPEQGRVFLDAVSAVNPDPKFRLLFQLMLGTGARYGESLALRWSQVNLDTRTIVIDRSVYRGVEKLPKTKAGIRTVGIPNALHEALLSYRERVQPGSEDLVFENRRGSHLDPNGVRRYVFRRALEASDLPQDIKDGLVIHSLRHSFCSWLALADVPLEVAMEIAGHSSPSVHLGYRHATEAAKRGAEAISALG